MSDTTRPLAHTLLLLAASSVAACSSGPGGGESTSSGAQALNAGDAGTDSGASAPLTWVGSTALAYVTPFAVPVGTPANEIAVPASFVVANNDLSVTTDTYPSGAATSVTLFWANADYSSVSSAPMTFTSATDGPYADDDRFVGTIPAASLPGGAAVHYWVRAEGGGGVTLYDSQNGANYTVVPRALSVGWAGNIGAYDAQGGLEFYQVGKLFNADLSTTVGCSEDGDDDYSIQAIEVYVPGLTDQGYTGDLANAAFSLIQAELWTDMRPGGWGPISTTCRPGIGNNYVCNLPFTVFPSSVASCLPGGEVPAGNYQYKVRFSVDGGTTWYWVGSIDGSGGGSNLNVQYGPTCPFAENDPAGCTTTN